jgi:hypothetical protein
MLSDRMIIVIVLLHESVQGPELVEVELFSRRMYPRGSCFLGGCTRGGVVFSEGVPELVSLVLPRKSELNN